MDVTVSKSHNNINNTIWSPQYDIYCDILKKDK